MKKTVALFLVAVLCLISLTSCFGAKNIDTLADVLSELGYVRTGEMEFHKYIMDNFGQGGAAITSETIDKIYEEGMKTYIFENGDKTVLATEFLKEKNISQVLYGYPKANLKALKDEGVIWGTIYVSTADESVYKTIKEHN